MRDVLTVLLTLASTAAVASPGFDPAQCRQIADVEVADDVKVEAERLTFREGRDVVTVSPDVIAFGGRTIYGPEVARYHADLRAFLASSTKMSKASRDFAFSKMGSAATDMCGAILAVERSAKAVQARDPAFRSPVQITLR